MKLLIYFMLLLLEKKKCDISMTLYSFLSPCWNNAPSGSAHSAESTENIWAELFTTTTWMLIVLSKRLLNFALLLTVGDLNESPFCLFVSDAQEWVWFVSPTDCKSQVYFKNKHGYNLKGGIINLRNAHGLQFLVSRQKSARKRFHFPNVTGRRNRETSIRLSQIRHFDP